MPILSRRFLGLCYGVQTRSLASCLRHQPRQEPRALTRMRGSVRGDWRKPVPYRDGKNAGRILKLLVREIELWVYPNNRTFPRYNLIEVFERLNLITVCVFR